MKGSLNKLKMYIRNPKATTKETKYIISQQRRLKWKAFKRGGGKGIKKQMGEIENKMVDWQIV